MKSANSLYNVLKSLPQDSNLQLAYHRYFNIKTAEKRFPYNASLELSPICNFDCQMCYVRMTADEVNNSGHSLLRFEDWKYFIDGLCELGTENFSLSGGECMLHPDFIRIYEYIYDLGKFVSLITNCSCLNDKIFNMFLKRPPSAIYVTIYGGSEETYDIFCKNRKAYHNVVNNIDRLLEAKLHIHLLCTLGNGNISDKQKIEEFADERGLKVDFAANLMSYGKCDNKKLEIAQLDLFKVFHYDDNFYNNYIFPKMDHIEIRKKGLVCSATKNRCSISWRGTMRPCVTFEPFNLNPRIHGGIKKCWETIVEWGDNVPLLEECQTCLFRFQCTQCIAMHYNDTHEFGKPSPRLCFKIQHPEEAAKLQAEYDRRQAEKAKSAEKNNKTETTPDQGVVS